ASWRRRNSRLARRTHSPKPNATRRESPAAPSTSAATASRSCTPPTARPCGSRMPATGSISPAGSPTSTPAALQELLAIENRVAAATVRVEKMSQAILAKAFRGELVPTEAELARQEGRDYEPTAVLLERIRTERAQANGAAPPSAGRRTRRTK